MKRFSLVIVALLLVLLVAACAQAVPGKESVEPPMPAGLRPGDQSASLKAGKAEERTLFVAPKAAPPPAPTAAPAPPASSASFGLVDRLVIYTAQLSLVVEDATASLETVTALARAAGGFVVSTHLYYREEQKVASVTIKVPATAYLDTMSQLRKIAVKVEREESNARDVTEEFSDLEAQLRNLEATEAQYLTLLKKANTIDEILRVQQRLEDVRNRIERTRGRMNFLERQSDMATITVNLTPQGLAKPKPKLSDTWDPGKLAQESWEASMAMFKAVATVVIRAGVFFWWLFPLLLLGGLTMILVRRGR